MSIAKIRVTFDLEFAPNGANDQCHALVGFEFLDHPGVKIPDHLKELLLKELVTVCLAGSQPGAINKLPEPQKEAAT